MGAWLCEGDGAAGRGRAGFLPRYLTTALLFPLLLYTAPLAAFTLCDILAEQAGNPWATQPTLEELVIKETNCEGCTVSLSILCFAVCLIVRICML